jgi:hypothetical protein
MQDWETRLNRFIAATDREVLSDAGKVTAEIVRGPDVAPGVARANGVPD